LKRLEAIGQEVGKAPSILQPIGKETIAFQSVLGSNVHGHIGTGHLKEHDLERSDGSVQSQDHPSHRNFNAHPKAPETPKHRSGV
jgi:hypothetical protein